MAESSAWSEAEVRAFLERERLRYQKIELPYGLSTPGRARRETAALILDDYVAGKSLLDVGSFLGYFCLQALERGAASAEGWELDPDRVRQATTLAAIKGLSPVYRQQDVEASDAERSFDVVICLNVLHHMYDPIATLEKLIRMTRETLVLELASVGPHDRWKLDLSRWQARSLESKSMIAVAVGSTSHGDDSQKFFFTRSAIENLVMNHRNHFARLTFHESEFPGRFIAIAERRRVENMVLVAGPTASGKTTLLRAIGRGELPSLQERVGEGPLQDWPQMGPVVLRRDRQPRIERLLLHYDFLRPYMRSARTLARDEGLDVLQSTDALKLVTLWTPPETLHAQIRKRDTAQAVSDTRSAAKAVGRRVVRRVPTWVDRIPGLGKFTARLRKYQPTRRKRAFEKLYTQPERVVDMYQRWFEYCDTLGPLVRDHVVVEMVDGEPLLRDVATWQREVAEPLLAQSGGASGSA